MQEKCARFTEIIGTEMKKVEIFASIQRFRHSIKLPFFLHDCGTC
jgi:hypothetical protein